MVHNPAKREELSNLLIFALFRVTRELLEGLGSHIASTGTHQLRVLVTSVHLTDCDLPSLDKREPGFATKPSTRPRQAGGTRSSYARQRQVSRL